MAYTTINKSSDHFNTKLYTGTGSAQSITGVGFQPDLIWGKNRSATWNHIFTDAVRGANKQISSNLTNAEESNTGEFTAFGSDGFSVGTGSTLNGSGNNICSWNWKAGGTAPAITYVVKVVSDSGNKYRFDDFGTSAVTLDLQEGGTYTFDQSDSSNSGHPLRFSTTSNGSHGGGSEYTTGVTTNGTPGSSGAYTRITVAASAPTLYYYCTNHSAMGGQANTNSTFGSSNFGGSIQSTVSANTTSGFSISQYTGTGSNATVGHGLGVAPSMIITKSLVATQEWCVGMDALGWDKYLFLNETSGSQSGSTYWQSTAPTSTVFSVGTAGPTNSSSAMIAYCFAEKTGFSKFGSYTGNGSATDGTFVYTGFVPAFVICKVTSTTDNWLMFTNKIGSSTDNTSGFNIHSRILEANGNGAEQSVGSGQGIDFVSNGFKIREDNANLNGSGATYIYMAFAEAPLVGSNNVPCNAR